MSNLSKSLVSKFGDRAVQVVTDLAATRAGRVANGVARTAEALTPLTLPLTPTNVGINAAAGTAINDLMRTAMDEETLIGNTVEAVGENPITSVGVTAGLTSAAAITGCCTA